MAAAEKSKNNFMISVVMAVYNVEEYIDEAIESIIGQSIGFDNIQLVLVDDGSPDGCPAICDRYHEKYPRNVVVIHKQNGGAAMARYDGIQSASGKYISFIDPDDTITPTSFAAMYEFFEKHYDEVDLVSMPMYFFGDKTGPHVTNYKFEQGTRVINLLEEYTMFQTGLASALVKREAACLIGADPKLKVFEDAREALKILLNKNTMGVVAEACYNYRRRMNSAVATSGSNKSWYTDSLRYFSDYMLEYSKKQQGNTPKYIQFAVMYFLQWQYMEPAIREGVLTEEEEKVFRAELARITAKIDDDIIMEQRNLPKPYKFHVLFEKYRHCCNILPVENGLAFSFSDTAAFNLEDSLLRLDFIRIGEKTIEIEGAYELFQACMEEVQLEIRVNGSTVPYREIERTETKKSLGCDISSLKGFWVEIPLTEQNTDIVFCFRLKEVVVPCKNLYAAHFVPLSQANVYKKAFYVCNNWKLTFRDCDLHVEPARKWNSLVSEIAFCKELWSNNREGGRKAVLARTAFHMIRPFLRKPLWLISDRASKAGDNGLALFRYMQTNHPEINTCFVINSDCAGFQEVQKFGPVVARNSFKHKMMTLLCDYMISSQAEIQVYNPFEGHSEPYRDIMGNSRFIFLQHGITKDDISGWVNKYQKNLYGFVTAAHDEYDSILNGNYHYTDREVWLTGFPRFDYLYHDEKKQITIMPTWRKFLMKDWDPITDIWALADDFKNSDYYHFYNALLNNEKLLDAAKKMGYQIAFFPHPNLQPHLNIFDHSDGVLFLDSTNVYNTVYAVSDLMVTDYSSAVFDFAYLRKPVLYSQFDADTFFDGGHAYTKGYFDYERDGFGEVEYDLEGTVNRIIEYMQNGCVLKDQYRERIDRFFAYDDQDNCQRVYEKIMELETEDQRRQK